MKTLFQQLRIQTREYCEQSECLFDSSDVQALLNDVPYVLMLLELDFLFPNLEPVDQPDHTALFVLLSNILLARHAH